MIRILIADDEMLERAVLCKTLREKLGDPCAIFQAENGREALKIYEEQKIQIVILDIEMPGINGIEAAERIREKDKECCIIFLTAFDEFAYARKAITVRALDYLLKPYDEQELMLVMEEAIRLTKERGKDKPEERDEKDRSQEKETLEDRGGKDSSLKKTSEEGVEKHSSRERAMPEEEDKKGSRAKEMQESREEYENVRLSLVREAIIQYIRENYMYDISMQDLAHTMNYSEAYFCKLFKQCFGRNFTSYLTEYRVEEAKKLLEQESANIKEIGRAVGYSDSNYFTKVFRRIAGVSPTEYRTESFYRGKR